MILSQITFEKADKLQNKQDFDGEEANQDEDLNKLKESFEELQT